MNVICAQSNGDILNDLNGPLKPGFQTHSIFEVEYTSKMVRPTDKVTIGQYGNRKSYIIYLMVPFLMTLCDL